MVKQSYCLLTWHLLTGSLELKSKDICKIKLFTKFTIICMERGMDFSCKQQKCLCSSSYSLCNLSSTSPPYSEVLTDIYLFFLRTVHFLSLPNCLLFGFVLTP